MTGPEPDLWDYEPVSEDAWRLVTGGDDRLRESSRQSRFALSNGFLGVRGAGPSTCDCDQARLNQTSVAGLFETSDAADSVPRLIPAPDWLQVRLGPPGDARFQEGGDVTTRRTCLEMNRGVLVLECDHVSADFAVRIHQIRLVSIRRRPIGLQRVRFEVVEGDIDIRLTAEVAAADASLILEHEQAGRAAWRTRRSGKILAMAISASLTVDGATAPPTATTPLGGAWTWRARAGQRVEFERLVAFGRGSAGAVDTAILAQSDLDAALALGFEGVLSQHEQAWSVRWGASDVQIDGDPAAQKAIRFATYHLNSAANPDDEAVSIAARALTGDDYVGHVFWDTEIFLLPFYCLTWPEAARALLMYRFHTLDGARAKAIRLGWRGALYAWESADTGADVTPAHTVGPDRQVLGILCGTQEQHISADVAYAVWQYWVTSGDEGFMRDAGAEILLETARFWVSRGVLEADGRRHIRGVIGPDEYHETIDDNAFTNVMARWNVQRGLEVVALLRRRWPERWEALSASLGLAGPELESWSGFIPTIQTGLDPTTGLYEQFEGYGLLEPVDLATYAGRSVPMDVVLGRKRTARSQVIKQADVVALLVLLPDVFTAGTGAANFAWYEPRCSHGSSLSTAMHGLAAARLGLTDKALDFFRRTAAIDLGDDKAAIGGGVHIAALGGLWMMAVLGFAGLNLREDGIGLRPQLPKAWTGLRFPLQWRGRRLAIDIDPADACIHILVESGEAMAAYVGGARYWLEPGQSLRIDTPPPAIVSPPHPPLILPHDDET